MVGLREKNDNKYSISRYLVKKGNKSKILNFFLNAYCY